MLDIRLVVIINNMAAVIIIIIIFIGVTIIVTTSSPSLTGCDQITWIPILWAQKLLQRAWNEGLICGEHLYHALNRYYTSDGDLASR